MKSILQEASTIAKAIEQGWREAGEPSEFSVKILELPQRNFIGLTTRSAKIAFIFNNILQKNQDINQKNGSSQTSKPYTSREKTAPRQPHATPAQEKKHLQSHTISKQHSTSVEITKNSTEQVVKDSTHNKQTYSNHSKQAPYTTKSHFESQKPSHEASSLVHEAMNNDISSENSATKKRAEGLWNEEIVAFARDWLQKTFLYMQRNDITFTIEPQNFYLRITLSTPVFTDEGQEKHLLASLSSLMFATIKKNFRKALRGHKIVLTHVKN